MLIQNKSTIKRSGHASMDFRKIPNIYINCVVFGLLESGVNVLLSKRELHMYDKKYSDINDWVLLGDLVLKSEQLDESADRVFRDYTTLSNVYKKQFRTFGNPERVKDEKDLLWLKSKGIDTRIFSVIYYFLIPSSKIKVTDSEMRWFPIDQLPQLGFDHELVIKRSFDDLQRKVLNEPAIFEFLEDKFTLNELHFAYESVLGIEIDNRNFRKKALNKTYIISLDEKKVTGNSKKPSNLYMFSKDIYDKIAPQNHIINI